jgi:hypothetical protein
MLIHRFPKQFSKQRFLAAHPLPVFDKTVLDFFAELSTQIFKDPDLKTFPEVGAAAFWFRKAGLAELKKKIDMSDPHLIRMAMGTIFHIVPSNVDILWIYTWVSSLLMGNKTILRLSETESPATDFFIKHLTVLTASPHYTPLNDVIWMVQYPKSSTDITQELSNLSTLRVIWGNNATIKTIQSIPLQHPIQDIIFGHRFSYAVFDAQKIDELSRSPDEFKRFIDNFIKDTFLFNQNACASPHTLFWMGTAEQAQQAKAVFWKAVMDTLQKENDWPDHLSVKKLHTALKWSLKDPSIVCDMSQPKYAFRVEAGTFLNDFKDHCGGGLFPELVISELNDIAPYISSEDQTITTFGVTKQEWEAFFSRYTPGIYRVVPVGKALEFSINWDGINLFQRFSKTIQLLVEN